MICMVFALFTAPLLNFTFELVYYCCMPNYYSNTIIIRLLESELANWCPNFIVCTYSNVRYVDTTTSVYVVKREPLHADILQYSLLLAGYDWTVEDDCIVSFLCIRPTRLPIHPSSTNVSWSWVSLIFPIDLCWYWYSRSSLPHRGLIAVYHWNRRKR